MTQTFKAYKSDFGTVLLENAPKEIADALASSRMTKNGDFDARTKSGKAAMKAKEQLDRLILEAWNKADKEALHKLGLKYY